jgi:gamma-glutamyltranspeptidase / glutathione hydrolase
MAKGIVAAGHPLTLQAAEDVLNAGGNAFDAAIAAFYAACVAEPVLASPGGGGFLLAKPVNKNVVLYDFFVQTPKNSIREDVDFLPILADFGKTKQEFHIGLASIATPGAIRGLFDVHRDLASIAMRELVQPAVAYSKQGVQTNDFQAYILDIVSPIFLHSKAAHEIYRSHTNKEKLLTAGEVYFPTLMADSLENIAIEGDRLFYEGEIAQYIHTACQSSGGLLTKDDLLSYQCIKRKPLNISYRNCQIFTNPPPSSGGILIAFALKLLEQIDMADYSFASAEYIQLLAYVMEQTQKARLDQALEMEHLHQMLDENLLAEYGKKVKQHAQSFRGTTHVSIIDKQGNMAALTLSNGEGCGHMLADSGIMLNNMLGEQDLNPQGFFKWKTDQRMTSMMSPSIMLFDDARHVVTGSGGSNRIRTALLQVMVNLIDYKMPVDAAVLSPRLHVENNELNIEGQFSDYVLDKICREYSHHQVWPEPNLFFGGAHSVMQDGSFYSGVGDCRRGGVCR